MRTNTFMPVPRVPNDRMSRRPDNPHRFFHEDKEIAIQEQELRNKQRRKAKPPECMTDAGKRRGRNKKERRADGQRRTS